MADLKADIVVLGAGMVGVGAALHLQKRGRNVMLVDKHGRGRRGDELRQCRDHRMRLGLPLHVSARPVQILRYATNRAPEARYSLADLPAFLPWLMRYYLASAPDRALRGAMAVLPLIRQSLVEHEALVAEAGVPDLLRRTGWIKMFRSAATLDDALRELERAKAYGVEGEVLDQKAIAQREPNLSGDFAGAIHFPAPGFVPDPGGLAKAYATLFRRKGGRFPDRRRAHAAADRRRTLARRDGGGAGHGARGRSWRWGRGPIWCSRRSAIRSRLR